MSTHNKLIGGDLSLTKEEEYANPILKDRKTYLMDIFGTLPIMNVINYVMNIIKQ